MSILDNPVAQFMRYLMDMQNENDALKRDNQKLKWDLESEVKAEREACALIAQTMGGVDGKMIALLIRKRAEPKKNYGEKKD